MEKKFNYETQEQRNELIVEQSAIGLRLKEDHIGLDESWLIFTDESYVETVSEPIPKSRDLATEVDWIKSKVEMLEKQYNVLAD